VAMTRVPIAARDLRAQKSNGNADSPSHPAEGEYEGGGHSGVRRLCLNGFFGAATSIIE